LIKYNVVKKKKYIYRTVHILQTLLRNYLANSALGIIDAGSNLKKDIIFLILNAKVEMTRNYIYYRKVNIFSRNLLIDDKFVRAKFHR